MKRHDLLWRRFVGVVCPGVGRSSSCGHACYNVLCCRRPAQSEALEKSNRPPSYVFVDQSRQQSIVSISEILNCKFITLQVVNEVRDAPLRDMCAAFTV